MKRCSWCTNDAQYQHYHDTEWGVPSRDAHHLFEKIILEGFQAGLSWLTILRKREHFRKVMFNFDPKRLAAMTDAEIYCLLNDPGIIRNRLKLQAARSNAQAWLSLENPVELIWSVTGGKTIIGNYANHSEIPTTSTYSHELSKLLKKAGFKFVGPTICHAYLQSVGVLMEHTTDCFRYSELV